MSAVLEPGELTGNVLYEVIDGEFREVEPMGAFAVQLAAVLFGAIQEFARTAGCGVAAIEQLFLLRRDPALLRRPDLAFVKFDRWQPPDPAADAWDVIPHLAVEVVSPSNSAREIEAKIVDYFAAGVERVWVLHPETRRLYLHESPRQVRVFGEHDEVDASPAVPGFRFTIAELVEGVQNPPGRPRAAG